MEEEQKVHTHVLLVEVKFKLEVGFQVNRSEFIIYVHRPSQLVLELIFPHLSQNQKQFSSVDPKYRSSIQQHGSLQLIAYSLVKVTINLRSSS